MAEDARVGKAGGAWSAYRAAGVDIDAGEKAVDLFRGAVEATSRTEVIGGIGGFAAAVALPAGYRDPILVSSTDGVGTKTAIAMALDRYDTIGHDLVAMCVDDLVCAGAEPLFFLDYLTVGRIVPERVAEIVGSVADGCRIAGCALVGGETAEHPGLMEPHEFDLGGFSVGIVERERLLDGSGVREGDALVGIASSGLHSNGFSLVRRLVADAGLDLGDPYADVLERVLGAGAEPWAETDAAEPEMTRRSLGDELLTPTRIYAQSILRLRTALDAAGAPLHAVAHITGGGLPGNVPRVLPDGLGALLDPSRWPMPSAIRLMGALGGLGGVELRSTFNGGLGMVAVVPEAGVGPAIEALAADGLTSWEVGRVVASDTIGGARYREGSLGR